MIFRSIDSALIEAVTKEMATDFDARAWTDDIRNIALVKGDDINLFQYQSPGMYIGHFFYKSRGREALETAKEMLAFFFAYSDADSIIGLTPVEKLGAKWMARKLGFKSYGEVDTIPGRCELFILTRKEYEDA